MAYFFCITFFVLFFVSKKIRNNHDARLLIRIVTAIWFGVFFLSILNVNNLFSVSDRTYSIIGFGALSLILGLFIGGANNQSINHSTSNDESNLSFDSDIQVGKNTEKLLFAYQIVFYVLLVLYIINVIVSGFDIYTMRLGFNGVIKSTSLSAIYDVFIRPGFIAISLVSSIYIVQPNTRRKATPLLITTALSGIVGVGRVAYVYFLFDTLIYFKIYKYRIEIKDCNSGISGKSKNISKTKRIIRYLGISVVVLLVIITNLRSTGKRGFLSGLYALIDTIISYVVGPFRAFELRADMFVAQNGYLHGSATLAGIDQFVFTLKAFLGFGNGSSYANNLIGQFTNEYFWVGEKTIFNFAITAFFIPYIDFGVVGVIIIPLLGGLLIGFFCKKMNTKPNMANTMVYLLCAEMLYYSLFSYRFQSMSCMLLLITLIVVGSERIKLK